LDFKSSGCLRRLQKILCRRHRGMHRTEGKSWDSASSRNIQRDNGVECVCILHLASIVWLQKRSLCYVIGMPQIIVDTAARLCCLPNLDCCHVCSCKPGFQVSAVQRNWSPAFHSLQDLQGQK
jgi:hypothetical protein